MITDLNLLDEFATIFGLRPARMRGLGAIVAIAGPNGAGKSRLLRALSTMLRHHANPTLEAAQLRDQYLASEKSLEIVRTRPIQSRQDQQDLDDAIHSRDSTLAIYRAVEQINVQHPVTFSSHPQVAVVELDYDTSPGQFSNANDMKPADVDSAFNQTRSPGFSNAYKNSIGFLQTLAEVAQARKLEGLDGEPEEVMAFNKILTALTGHAVHFRMQKSKRRFVPWWKEREFMHGELSQGERILLAWAIVLHKQRQHLHASIVLIDEPEQHLHPAACVQALRGLRDVLGPEAQVWITTHALGIISYAGPEATYAMYDGLVQFAGSRLPALIQSLLGDDEQRAAFESLVASAERMALFEFSAQCLLAPRPVSARLDDPQEEQALEAILDGSDQRVLDFGAGRGRLAAALARSMEGQMSPNGPKTYVAYCDPQTQSASDTDECARNVALLNSTEVDASSTTTLPTSHFDVALLCNVLHEVHPRDWPRTLAAIAEHLNVDGHVVVMEDQEPTIGELPHPDGFIPLSATEIATLCGGVPPTSVRYKRSHRLSAFSLSRSAVLQATMQTTINTLRQVQTRSLSEVSDLRSSGITGYQAARHHATRAMIYVNASLALATLEKEVAAQPPFSQPSVPSPGLPTTDP
ncbi:MAG: AAA family ATPase [Polyangiaceae bacterium]|nr:AAA family ATPase [Polyangiaceae bacterium]